MEEKKNYCAIDILKFVCSLLVVILHTVSYGFADLASDSAPPTGKDNPFLFTLPAAFTILRIAVPVFFISSAFFVFKKVKENPDEGKFIIKKYCLRLFKLFLFWFVVSTPIMIDKYIVCGKGNVGQNILELLWRIVFYGGFDGAWYLVTSLVCVPLVYWLSTKMKDKYMFLIAGVMYAIASLSGTYFHLFDGTFISNIFSFFNNSVPLYHSFFNGTLFVAIGRAFAYKENLIAKKLNTAILCISPLLMYGELVITNYFGLNFATDCFFTLTLFSTALFQFVVNKSINPKNIYKTLRESSTFIYLFHFIFLYILYRFASSFGWSIFYGNILVIISVYITIILVSILLCRLVKKLSNKFPILKYAI